jgi:vacuolar-type H+-ATPase subunit E/Vma4
MALSDLLQKISDEASKKTAFMRQVADDEIKKIQEEAAGRAETRKQEILQKADEKGESMIQKAKVLAKMESRSELLKEKRTIIDSVYTQVLDELNSMPPDDYTDLVAKMLKQAATLVEGGVLVVPKARKSETEKALKQAGVSMEVSGESGAFKGGFILQGPKSEVNYSFPYLLERILRPQTELEVAKTLFE